MVYPGAPDQQPVRLSLLKQRLNWIFTQTKDTEKIVKNDKGSVKNAVGHIVAKNSICYTE